MKKDKFFTKIAAQSLALTFDDVRLKTSYSEVMPGEVNLETMFSRHIPLKIPIVSAAMDTVTEYVLAIELAKLGGIGVVHRGLSAKEQASMVTKVKLHLNGRIDKPICIKPDQTMESVLNMKNEKDFPFNTFPVVDEVGKLVGVITGSHFEFCQDMSHLVRQEMATEVVDAMPKTDIHQVYELMNKHRIKFLPLIDDKKKLVGLYTFKDLKRIISGSSPENNLDEEGQLRVAAAVGTGEEALERTESLMAKKVDVIVIDTAHGDSKSVYEILKAIKKKHDIDVVVGNISEPESAVRLAKAGADGIKVGQGPGSICTTRVIAGIGCPQVTAVYNCTKAVAKYRIPVCADGGIKFSGDIPVALGAGAHCVMLGNLLAGTEEAPGEIIFLNGRNWKGYRGMGSLGAMQESSGAAARYGQKHNQTESMIPEGIEGLVPYKGRLKAIIHQYIGGLKAGMGYVGAVNIEQLRDETDFHLITKQGQAESHPHDVIITKEAPNYGDI